MVPKHLREYVESLGLIALEPLHEEEYDLMCSATIRLKYRGHAELIPIHGGLTKDFFKNVGSSDGAEDLEKLFNQKSEVKLVPLIIPCEQKKKRSIFSAAASTATTEATYSVTNVWLRSLNLSSGLVPFLEKYAGTFVSNCPLLIPTFWETPSVWRGSIDKVVAFVVATLTAKVELQEDHHNDGEGIVGVCLCLVHLRKPPGASDVRMMDWRMMQTSDGPEMFEFLRRVHLKDTKPLVVGRPNARFGFVTEDESSMQYHDSFSKHVKAMKEKHSSLSFVEVNAKGNSAVSITYQGYNEATGLHVGQRASKLISKRAHCKYMFLSAPPALLEELYQTIKNEGYVLFEGKTILAMSPLFTVETRKFLPIYRGSLPEDVEVPGSVVRDQQGIAFIFPVEGSDTYDPCVTVFHDDWEVQESIVPVDPNDGEQISRLTSKGFHEIKVEGNESKVVMGRHKLILKGYENDNEEDVFRDPVENSSTSSDVPSVSSASSISSLQSTTDEPPSEEEED